MTVPMLSPHRCCDCLLAGKSPTHWRRDLARKTTRFDTIRRTCDWLQMPTGVVKLQQEPLLGSCLAALMGGDLNGTAPGADRTVRPKPEISRSPLPPSTINQPPIPKARSAQKQPIDHSCPPSEPRSRQQPAPNPATGKNPCSAQVPLTLEPKASPDLLCRWVDESVATRLDRDPQAAFKPQASGQPTQPAVNNAPVCPPSDRSSVKPLVKPQDVLPSGLTSPRSPKLRSFYQPPRSSRVSPLPTCPDATHHRRWLDRLAQHTDRRLHRERYVPHTPGFSTTVQAGQINQDTPLRSSASTTQAILTEPLSVPQRSIPQTSVPQTSSPVQGDDRPLTENSLTEQWSLPIAGQTAPIALLVYLAERTAATISPQQGAVLTSDRASNASVLPGGDRASTAPATAGYGSYGQSLDRWFTPSPTEEQRHRAVPSQSQRTRRSDVERHWTGDGQERSPNQPAFAAAPTPALAGSEPSAITTRSNEADHPSLPLIPLARSSDSTPSIAPPAVTPSLPALTAPQTGDSPTPSVASALTQHQAQQEAIAPADLGLLADQIKRILNEEARRHGINL